MRSYFRNVLAVRWLILVPVLLALFLIVRGTGSVIVDGFQSLGAVAGASGPGALRWPMLGGFLGYDQTWGFHWIGWPWLRSLLLQVLPWNPTLDLGLCCLIWGAMAWVLSRMVEKQEGRLAGTCVGITALISPGFLVAAQSYRPEIPTALALVVALSVWNASSTAKQAIRFLVCVILPTLHPMGLVVPGAWCGFDFVHGWRQIGFAPSFRQTAIRAAPLVLGLGLLAAWFVLKPLAWTQFKLNVESQRMLIDGLGTGYGTFFRWGLGSLGALPLIVLLACSTAFGMWRIIGALKSPDSAQPDYITHAAVGLLMSLGFNIVVKNPNSLHIVAVLPFAAWLFVSGLRFTWGHVSGSGFLIPMGLGWLLFLALPIKQAASLLKHRGTSYRSELEAGLASLPPARQVLIPVAMWEAAAMSSRKSATIYRFSTFPNLMPTALRADYERELLAQILPGDLMVRDALQDEGGIFNFVTTTALRHQIIRPPEDSASWERLPDMRLSTTYSRSQPLVFEVYRKR